MNDIESVRWQAVEGRDTRMDGVFVYAVRTTGVYCRPGCAARRPRRENVLFFSTPADAVVEGFRACRRCRPDGATIDDPATASVVAVCRWLEHPDEDHTPDALAARVGWSKRHLQRRFSEAVGVSMAAYGRAMQAERARRALQQGANVTDAVFDAGYGSTRAFYEHGAPRLGMPAAEYAAAGRGHRVSFTTFSSPIGEVIVAATERGLCAVRIGDDAVALAADLAAEYSGATLVEDGEHVGTLARQVAALAAGGGGAGRRRGRPAPGHPGHRLPGQRLGAPPHHPARHDGHLHPGRRRRRPADGGAGRRQRLWGQPGGRRHPLPPGGQVRRHAGRLPLGYRPQGRPAGRRAPGR